MEDGTQVISLPLYGDDTRALSVAGKTQNLKAKHWANCADKLSLSQKAATAASQLALRAASLIMLESLPFCDSPLRDAQREVRFRRAEFTQ